MSSNPFPRIDRTWHEAAEPFRAAMRRQAERHADERSRKQGEAYPRCPECNAFAPDRPDGPCLACAYYERTFGRR